MDKNSFLLRQKSIRFLSFKSMWISLHTLRLDDKNFRIKDSQKYEYYIQFIYMKVSSVKK